MDPPLKRNIDYQKYRQFLMVGKLASILSMAPQRTLSVVDSYWPGRMIIIRPRGISILEVECFSHPCQKYLLKANEK